MNHPSLNFQKGKYEKAASKRDADCSLVTLRHVDPIGTGNTVFNVESLLKYYFFSSVKLNLG